MKGFHVSFVALLVSLPMYGCGARSGTIAEELVAKSSNRADAEEENSANADAGVPGQSHADTEAPHAVNSVAEPSPASPTVTSPTAASSSVASPTVAPAPDDVSEGDPNPSSTDGREDDEAPPRWDGADCRGELHFLALYDTTEGSGEEVRSATVHVERPGSHVLVLSAYEPVRWTVTAQPGATVERVILNGYYDQEAVVAEGVAVESYTYETNQSALFDTAHTWSLAWGLGNPQAPVAIVEAEAQRPLTTFAGCYRASNFTLHEDASVSVDCSEGALSYHVNPPCQHSSVDFLDTGTTSDNVDFIPDSTADAWCWMLEPTDYGTLTLHQIDPADGSTFAVADFDSSEREPTSSFHTFGMALMNGRLAFSGYMGNEFQWGQIDLGTGLLTVAGTSNNVEAVTSNGSGLIARCGGSFGNLCIFENFLDLAQDNPSRRVAATELWGSVFTARGNLVYSARGSGNEVVVHDLPSGDKLRTIELEAFDDWNWGISLTADRLYLAANNSNESPACIVTFDPETGAQLNQVCVESDSPYPEWSGLWCDGIAE